MRSAAVLVALAPLLLPACSGEEEARVRNVVLISIDTLRFDHLGTYGYERDVSPAIDALGASRGALCGPGLIGAGDPSSPVRRAPNSPASPNR